MILIVDIEYISSHIISNMLTLSGESVNNSL